jgi:hypothetical protein
LSRAVHNLPPVIHIFGDESGSFRKGDHQLIGVVLTRDPIARRAELDSMRAAYPIGDREVKFSDTDALTLPYALAMIDWFLDSSDLEFKVIVWAGNDFDSAVLANNSLGLNAEDLAYNYLYKRVLAGNLPPNHRVLVTIDQRQRTKQNNLLNYLKAEVPGVRDVTEGDSKLDPLLQLADLLTGCVGGGLSGVTQPRKRALVERFQRGMGMRTARDQYPTKVTRQKFNLWLHVPKKTSPRQP